MEFAYMAILFFIYHPKLHESNQFVFFIMQQMCIITINEVS